MWTLQIRRGAYFAAFATEPRDTVAVRVRPSLWRWPELSEVEVNSRITHAGEHVLDEDAMTTLRCVLDEANGAIRVLCFALALAWSMRRADPTLLEQPLAQWPARKAPTSKFGGCAPGTLAHNPSQGRMGDLDALRWQAAALFDEGAHVWK